MALRDTLRATIPAQIASLARQLGSTVTVRRRDPDAPRNFDGSPAATFIDVRAGVPALISGLKRTRTVDRGGVQLVVTAEALLQDVGADADDGLVVLEGGYAGAQFIVADNQPTDVSGTQVLGLAAAVEDYTR